MHPLGQKIVAYKLETRELELQPANLVVAFKLTHSQEERELVRNSSKVYRVVHTYNKAYNDFSRRPHRTDYMNELRERGAELVSLLEYLPGYCPAVQRAGGSPQCYYTAYDDASQCTCGVCRTKPPAGRRQLKAERKAMQLK